MATIRNHRRWIIAWSALSMIVSVVALGPAWALRAFVDADASKTARTVFALLGMTLLQGVALIATGYVSRVAVQRVNSEMRRTLYGKLLDAPLELFTEQRTGTLLARLGDGDAMSNAIGFVIGAFQEAVTGIGALVAMLVISVKLTLALLACVPVIVILTVSQGERGRRLEENVNHAQAAMSSSLLEGMANVQAIQALGLRDHQLTKYDGTVRALVKRVIQRGLQDDVFGTLLRVVMAANIAGVVFLGRHFAAQHELTLGDVSAHLMYALMILMSGYALSRAFKLLKEAEGQLERVFAILDRPDPVADPAEPVAFPEKLATISFTNVAFAYRPGERVLGDVSFGVERGDVIAFVGSSGSGKTTIANLIQRFYDPTEGQVAIDDVDVKAYRKADLRAAIGVVPQEPAMFAASVEENIALGRLSASKEEIVRAAKLAHAHQFIEKLPHGYETIVGERGATLSGGQRQRIAIARAILRDPQILVLDEATSALDMESEAIVQAALNRLMRGRTTIIIAHRLATVQRATAIFVLDKGQIVASGKHDELAVRPGVYRDVYERAMRDHPTGLWNRAYATLELTKLVGIGHRYDRPFVVCAISFSVIGLGTLGAGQGLETVRRVTDLIQASVREQDIVAAFTVNEFVALLPETTMEGALTVAERIQKAARDALKDQQGTVQVGLAAFPADGRTPTELIENAKAAMVRSSEVVVEEAASAGA
jgi:subfamily B ATP-binding cassette protein MsbA